MIDYKIVYDKITNIIENIALDLMKLENKDFCLAKISSLYWRHLSYINDDKEIDIIIVSSVAFNRLILHREYLQVLDKYVDSFGKDNDWIIVKALREFNRKSLIREYTDEEYLEYLKGETMAYVFKIEQNNELNNRILRLDLCRGINRKDNKFMGGILHVLKHFTIEGYDTISSNVHTEFNVETWGDIYRAIILNFFSDNFKKEKGKCYESISLFKEHKVRGIYYKEENSPVYFINSFRVDNG